MESQAQTERVYRARGLAGSAFVGRLQEMDELKSALEDALSRQGRLVMLVGEPGIGKTRTAQESRTSFTTSKHSGTFPRAHFQTILTIYILSLLRTCGSRCF
jgi:MoxR-like ATPase